MEEASFGGVVLLQALDEGCQADVALDSLITSVGLDQAALIFPKFLFNLILFISISTILSFQLPLVFWFKIKYYNFCRKPKLHRKSKSLYLNFKIQTIFFEFNNFNNNSFHPCSAAEGRAGSGGATAYAAPRGGHAAVPIGSRWAGGPQARRAVTRVPLVIAVCFAVCTSVVAQRTER